MVDFRYKELDIKELIWLDMYNVYGFCVCIGGYIKICQILMALNILESP